MHGQVSPRKSCYSHPPRFGQSLLVRGALLLVVALLAMSPLSDARAQGLTTISDAEIEHSLRIYATPLLRAAGLNPDTVKLIIVKDKALNAFVAGGRNIFINTGLLQSAETPEQVIGVLAHEIGHIAGGHLSRGGRALEAAGRQTLVATLLGLAAAVATGRGEVAQAMIAGGQSIASRRFLSFSRAQESAADQAALTYLDRAGLSSAGLVEFMKKLSGQELLLTDSQDPYVRTHPLTQDRIATLRNHAERSRYRIRRLPDEIYEMHARMRAKLDGFFDAPSKTLRRYPEADRSIASRYARAIALYRIPDLKRALAAIDALIAERPNDPYFHELKGQILFENGRLEDAIPSYRRSVELAPDAMPLRLGLAHVLLESDKGRAREAIDHLRAAVRLDERSYRAWFNLGLAYAKARETGLSFLARAQASVIANKVPEARRFAQQAADNLAVGTPPWLRAQDILESTAPVDR